MGSRLAASVIREIPAQTTDRPEGWPKSLKWALTVAAESANHESGLLLESAATLADRAGLSERTVREALKRAHIEGLCRTDGHYRGRTRRIVFRHPTSIAEAEATSTSLAGRNGTGFQLNRKNDAFEAEATSDIPVYPHLFPRGNKKNTSRTSEPDDWLARLCRDDKDDDYRDFIAALDDDPL